MWQIVKGGGIEERYFVVATEALLSEFRSCCPLPDLVRGSVLTLITPL